MISEINQSSLPKKRIKVVLLGDRSVGKSSIINRFITNSFQQSLQPTVGVDFMGKNIKFKKDTYRIELWDTAGQQKYKSLVKGYLKGADACIFIYDCSSIKSYVSIPEWLHLFDSVATNQCFKIIVGNKCDSDFNTQLLQKTKTEVMKQNQELKLFPQFVSSAKLGINIEQIFQQIILTYIERQNKKGQNPKLGRIFNNIKKYSSSSCCQ